MWNTALRILATLAVVADLVSNLWLLIGHPRGIPIHMTHVIDWPISVVGRIHMSLHVSGLESAIFGGMNFSCSALLKMNLAFVPLDLFFRVMRAVSEHVGAAVRVCLVLACIGQRNGEVALLLLELMKLIGMGEGVNASGHTLT